ncbi:MAG TPA: hypothetical protein VNW46_00715 [Gemmatimonadaceae bacterium]|nr:hypothetical protein [Gemmatimonadaceae bacterium]
MTTATKWLLAAIALTGVARTAAAQGEFPQTRYWGTGLIDIPVASVSPLSGDFSIQYAGTGYQTSSLVPLYHNGLNSQGNLTVALFGRAEVGVTAFSGDPEQGFSGQLMLLRERDFSPNSILRYLPNVAFGVRNVGPYPHIDRFNLGYGETVNPNGGSAPVIRADSVHRSFETNNSVYGVATKGFLLSDIKSSLPEIGIDLTIGYGDGLFSNHGNLPVKLYASNATGGLFYGVDATMRPTPNTLVTIMGENNAWDFNVGAQVDWRGLRAGVAVTELGAGSQKINPTEAATAIYHYTKFAFTVGWHSNIFALFKGHFLENREAALRKERDTMLAEVAKRQGRIAELQELVKQYEAQNLLELEQRREAAQAELKAETEALHRLEERLKRVEQETGGQAPPPPPQAPPAPHP